MATELEAKIEKILNLETEYKKEISFCRYDDEKAIMQAVFLKSSFAGIKTLASLLDKQKT